MLFCTKSLKSDIHFMLTLYLSLPWPHSKSSVAPAASGLHASTGADCRFDSGSLSSLRQSAPAALAARVTVFRDDVESVPGNLASPLLPTDQAEAKFRTGVSVWLCLAHLCLRRMMSQFRLWKLEHKFSKSGTRENQLITIQIPQKNSRRTDGHFWG